MTVSRRTLIGGSAAGMVAASANTGMAGDAFGQTTANPPAAEGDLAAIKALIDAARTQAPELGVLMARQLPGLARGGAASVHRPAQPPIAGTTTVPTTASGDVAAVWGQEFLFAVAAGQPASLSIDWQPPVPMTRVAGTSYWFSLETLRLGTTHTYTLIAGGHEVGTGGVAAYNPDSYEQPGVPRGTLSERHTIHSRIYPGMSADTWVYANPGLDTTRGAPVMVWQDGARYVGALDLVNYRLQVVTDNLVAKRLIPPMVHVLVAPGTGGEQQVMRFDGDTQANEMRSLQYDTVSDRYGRYIQGEVLPQVERTHKLRQDAYSRAAAGLSSGAICAFNMAWFNPQSFSRVHSNIGSYTALQWHPQLHQDGGNLTADRVRREQRRNIRIWMSDGMNDLEADSHGRADLFGAGSWPLHNIALANALKLRGYDFHFRFGEGTHSTAQGAMDLPESLAWLWRGYDPDRVEQEYEQEPAERAKPIFRVRVANRDAW
ncbi:alpha/beta hydrolase [Lichenicoccus sp.]|uniref:alpha/beta hydrolase n=1 Tax=Lichenicoccus sp. TaxID=2781899 RepID=UPI003D11BDB2